MKKIVKGLLSSSIAFSMIISLMPATTITVKAEEAYKYVVMNIPFSEFYDAEQNTNSLVSLEQQTLNGTDAVSSATTSKYKMTSGLAKGTYYGEDTDASKGNMLGVTYPVKMTQADYGALKDTYLYVDEGTSNDYVTTVKGSHYFKDYEGVPTSFKTLTYNEG